MIAIVVLIAALVFGMILYSRQLTAENLLDTLELPLILVHSDSRMYSNPSARNLLKLNPGYNKINSVAGRIGNDRIRRALYKREEFSGELFFVDGRKISANGFFVKKNGKNKRFAVVFNEVTELDDTQKKLDCTRELAESLRFINHDFMNRMHVLMVYLETEQWENAKGYISSLQSLSVSEIASVVEIIRNPSVASLILSKIKKAADVGITVNLLPGSSLLELTDGISEGEYITITGNLLENAIEELSEISDKEKNIDLFVSVNSEWSVISVTDNGRGTCNTERIFDVGFSTKAGATRGIGLCAVKSIVDKHLGTVEVDTEPGEGFFINVVMKAEEKSE